MSDLNVPSSRPRGSGQLTLALVALVAFAAIAYFGFLRERAPAPLKLAIVTWTQDPFWDPLIRGAQASADRAKIQLTVVRSKPTVEAQTQHIRELLDGGIDGIAISPNDPVAQSAILNEAANKLPVVTFDSDAPDIKRRRFVGIDNYAAGRVCADEVREALPDGGRVLISVGSTTMQHGRDRRQGLIDGLLERGFDRNRTPDPLDAEIKGPRYTVVATATDGGDPATATKSIADALAAHADVRAIVGLFSYSAPCALEAMRTIGRAGGVQVIGFDDSDATQAALEAGTIHSSILQDSERCGHELIEVLANEARGVPRGPAEDSAALLTVGINVLTAKDLAAMRASGAIRQPANASPTTRPATS